MLFKRKPDPHTPPIYADLLIETPGGPTYRVDVDQSGWLKEVQPVLSIASRVGLVLRGDKAPRVWLTPNGAEPEYFSRVIGQIDESGERRIRVAGLFSGDVSVWLHSDGLVEVGPEPTYREV